MFLWKDLSPNCINAKNIGFLSSKDNTYLLLLCGCLVQNGAETVQPSNGANIKHIANVNIAMYIL